MHGGYLIVLRCSLEINNLLQINLRTIQNLKRNDYVNPESVVFVDDKTIEFKSSEEQNGTYTKPIAQTLSLE